MRVILYILIICMLSGTLPSERQAIESSGVFSEDIQRGADNYRVFFGDDYEDAISFINEYDVAFNRLSSHNKDQLMLKAIVFPELIRYSIFKDFFETEALEAFYVSYGSSVADFSIGRFQMKPSFVEGLECYVRDSESLWGRYGYIAVFNDTCPSAIRGERLNRMRSQDWQMRYLSCFYDITKERFPAINFQDRVEKLRFFATAYNCGFNCSEQEIRRFTYARTFPYGTHYTGDQFVYSDISVNYFTNHLKHRSYEDKND